MTVQNQLARRSAILAGIEGTYGADPVLVPATSGILINAGAELTPNAEKVDRNVLRDTFSPAGHVVGAKSLDLSIQVEARGGGITAGKPAAPDYDPLLLACGMQRKEVVRLTLAEAGAWQPGEVISNPSTGRATLEYVERGTVLVVSVTAGQFTAAETITGGTSAATGALTDVTPGLLYSPKTADPVDQKSATIYFWKDRILHKLVGVLGTWSLDCQVGKFAILDFKMSGLWVDPLDAALPAPTLTDLDGPQALALGLRVGAYTPVATALKLDLGNKIEKRSDLNAAEGLVGMLITGRSPSGSLDPETDTLANWNPWTAWKSGTRAAIAATIGSVAGNRFAVCVGAAQYSDLKYTERTGVSAYSLGFVPTQVRTGDDELYLCYF